MKYLIIETKQDKDFDRGILIAENSFGEKL